MMSLWDALRMNMMISYQELVRTFLSFGGTKENNNYPLMQMCVDTYFAQRKPLQALTLLHNYAWIMSSETTAFQERYDFNIDEWRAKFRQLCLEYFGDSRTQFT
ncbi:hypothetical protein OSL35_15030, partial [Escherichia coli]|nr:hypothetical protein [Escherichia coli]EFH9067527.1 hypothetical protein [Escherichia coli]MDA6682882.1 hypothetical protein [Escherichia coli]